jgi:energy-coupling factor transporter ATP-binding protein EcfA2
LLQLKCCDVQTCDTMMCDIGIEDYRDKTVHTLSGGTKRKLSVYAIKSLFSSLLSVSFLNLLNVC